MTEVEILVWMAFWTANLILPGTIGLLIAGGFPVGFGNRDVLPELPPWAARANRAHRNQVENLPVFIALVVAAWIAEVPSEATITGAQMFFWGRIAHGVVYIAGIPYIRTAAFVVSIGGLLRMGVAILSHLA